MKSEGGVYKATIDLVLECVGRDYGTEKKFYRREIIFDNSTYIDDDGDQIKIGFKKTHFEYDDDGIAGEVLGGWRQTEGTLGKKCRIKGDGIIKPYCCEDGGYGCCATYNFTGELKKELIEEKFKPECE